MDQNNKDLLQEKYVEQGGSTGYVQPTSVNAENVDITESHLNGRERDNIVKASIQANNNISEEQVTTVNNQIQINKKKPIILLIVLIIIGVAIFFIIKYIPKVTKKYIKTTTTTTVETTTTRNVELDVLNYLRDNNKARKFSNDTETLLLLPYGYDLHENVYYYAYISNDNNEVGTYKLGTDKISLVAIDTMKEFNIEKGKIKTSTGLLSMNDDIKLYTYKDSNISKLLVLSNATAFYLDSTNLETSTSLMNYTENDTSIQVDDKVFNKVDEKTIEIDNVKLTLN